MSLPKRPIVERQFSVACAGGSSHSRPAWRGTGCTWRAENRDGEAEEAGGRLHPLEKTGAGMSGVQQGGE